MLFKKPDGLENRRYLRIGNSEEIRTVSHRRLKEDSEPDGVKGNMLDNTFAHALARLPQLSTLSRKLSVILLAVKKLRFHEWSVSARFGEGTRRTRLAQEYPLGIWNGEQSGSGRNCRLAKLLRHHPVS